MSAAGPVGDGMAPVAYLDLVRGMLVSRYGERVGEVGPLAAAEEVVAVAREQLALHDGTAWHPGARRLAQWLSAARADGDGGDGPLADRFEDCIGAFLTSGDPFRPALGHRPRRTAGTSDPALPSTPPVSPGASR